MRNRHNIMFERSTKIETILKELAFAVDGAVLVIELYEDDTRWPDVQKLIQNYHGYDRCTSEYSDVEIAQAEWLEIFAPWQIGYPQPEGKLYEYVGYTYNTADFCNRCGVGLVQDKPFLLKTEPKWGKKKVFSLHWIADAFFVSPETWKEVFMPLGIEYWPVLQYNTKEVMTTLVQLKITNLLPGSLNLDHFDYTVCSKCRRKKYDSITCGVFPPMSKRPDRCHIMHSQEFFGAGCEAYRETFVSHDLYRLLSSKKINPLKFTPVSVV